MSFSLVINHTPWREDRERALRMMLGELRPPLHGVPFLLNDTDYRGTEWQVSKVAWALNQWRWALEMPVSHHIFMTDDLHLVPGFWRVLEQLVAAAPRNPIGLLSNHPRGPELARQGYRWYATNSWIVGPAYVMPHEQLACFLKYFEALPDGDWRTPGTRGYRNDDSSINEWVTFGEGSPRRTLHPLPTIIEHRDDLESTVGHGDEYSRERLSWRFEREVEWLGDDSGRFVWRDFEIGGATSNGVRLPFELEQLGSFDFWREKGGPDAAPLLGVGE